MLRQTSDFRQKSDCNSTSSNSSFYGPKPPWKTSWQKDTGNCSQEASGDRCLKTTNSGRKLSMAIKKTSMASSLILSTVFQSCHTDKSGIHVLA